MPAPWDPHPSIALWDGSEIQFALEAWESAVPRRLVPLSERLEHAATLLLCLACGTVAVLVRWRGQRDRAIHGVHAATASPPASSAAATAGD